VISPKLVSIDAVAGPALTSYQKRLLAFLSVATFFEGYDFLALSQILPNLRAEFGLHEGHAGWLVGFVNLGTVFAYFLVRRADKWGRRRVLMITIIGYTVFTFASGLAPDPITFAIFQFFARVFLIGEWAVSMVIAAEEFPALRRGMVIGVIQAFASLGSVLCAGVVPFLLKTPYGWRSVYFVGIIPLIIVMFMRRGLKETKRFAAVDKDKPQRSFWGVWSTPYKKRVIQLGLIWFCTFACSQTAITFWKEFALGERGFTDAQVGTAVTIAAVVAMPMVFLSGKLLDVVGRKVGATIIYGLAAIGTVGCYTLHGFWPLTAALVLGVFGVSAVLPVLYTFTTELFPTELRGDAFSWANNIIGRVSYVFAPVIVATAAQTVGWGPAVASTVVFPLIALGLIWLFMPETNAMDLDDTALME